ncbi:MAG: M3 family oligoendopeptidase, partial [Planctomycetaceae bacterium]
MTATATQYALTWDLDSLLPHPRTQDFLSLLDEFRRDLERLAAESDGLPRIGAEPASVRPWVGFLRGFESVAARSRDLNAFIGCHAAADAESKLFQQLEGQLSALSPLQEKIATNIQFALKDASAAGLKAFTEADPWLGEIAFFLEDSRRNAALRLPREQELLAADLAVDGLHAWGRLYDRLSGALRITVMEKGELVKKSPGQVQFDSPERTVRENNFHAADKAWATIADTCADALNHIAGTRLTVYRRLRLTDHLEPPLRYNRLRRETLETMWNTITERKGCLLDYLSAKAKLLGLDALSWYDATAPLPVSPRNGAGKLSWDKACDTVIETFHGFSPEFGEFARKAIVDRWIEAED